MEFYRLMPMPKHIDTEALIDMLDPKKDIDGLTTYNIGLVTAGKGGFAPCTAKACLAYIRSLWDFFRRKTCSCCGSQSSYW